jgi:hypothetical protein
MKLDFRLFQLNFRNINSLLGEDRFRQAQQTLSDFTNKYINNLIQSMSEYEGGTYRCTICAKEFSFKR